ncbi:lecithin retinol acyltransferase family protein [Marinobacterium marinum]|uniref:Lecithin retinol acyltransferase family protein n=1 Tax=Marinobacterium marinum TaxID=2756129 RepID=A0A7W1WVQ1_9GAMM|nr:lecithin retinol acyltransferase family protein [Marinobacterium marinum]MBA4500871.1 lecithin retinol acyltransferase family protein [Marinobacterium marinum]
MNLEEVQLSSEVYDFMTKAQIDHLLMKTFRNSVVISDFIENRIDSLSVGDHLVTPRNGYNHHGIFVGIDNKNSNSDAKCIIHYSGLADGLKSGPIEKVSLTDFCCGSDYRVQPHDYIKYSREEAAQRAYDRLNEESYNLLWNNCENFVNWCIDGTGSSRQVNGVLKTATKTTLKHIGKSNPLSNMAIVIAENARCLRSYINGDIDKRTMLNEISHSAVTSTSMFWYGSLGQAAIPIPAVGFLLGSAAGFFIGNSLHQSGHIALGETASVREAKKRRKEIEDLCEELKSEIKKNRENLENYLELHFSERVKEFKDNFNKIDSSIISKNNDDFISALEVINSHFDKALDFKSFDDFDAMMESEDAFQF